MAWTDIVKVCGEIPAFKRGGNVSDAQIATWIDSVAQSITGALIKRGLPSNPASWPARDDAAMLNPADVLELINREGAAARLAAYIGGQFGSGEWGLAKNLQSEYLRELGRLESGAYDKLFKAAAATTEAGPQLSVGDQSDPNTGESTTAFTKGKVF